MQPRDFTFELVLCAVKLEAQAHDLFDSGKVHAEFLGQAANLAQVFDIALRIQPRFAARASRSNQAFAFVQSQRLRVHVHEFCRDRDHVNGPVFGIGRVVQTGVFKMPTDCTLEPNDFTLELRLHVVEFVTEFHDLFDARQIHAEFLGQAANFAQVLNVTFGVQAGFAARAVWTDQAFAFVQTQGLWMHVHEFCRHGDHVNRAIFGISSHISRTIPDSRALKVENVNGWIYAPIARAAPKDISPFSSRA